MVRREIRRPVATKCAPHETGRGNFLTPMTPETDYQAVNVIGFYSCATVPADFARKLERERNEAQADRAHLIIIARDRLEKIRQLEREIEAHTLPKLLPNP